PDPGDYRDTEWFDTLEEPLQLYRVEYRLSYGKLRSGLHFVAEPLHLMVQIRRSGVGTHTDDEAGGLPNAVSAGVHPTVERGRQVGQSNRINVEDRSCVG